MAKSVSSSPRSSAIPLVERLSRIMHNAAYAEGLKPTQWEALRYIARANHFSRNPGALTSYLGTTKGTVSQTLHALERKQLIEKHASKNDRRGVQLELTAEGRKLLERDPLLTVERTLERQPRSERQSVEDGLQTLLHALLEERSGKPFGICKNCTHFKREGGGEEEWPHFCQLLQVPLSREDSDDNCIEQETPRKNRH
ncbi:MAG: MarR family transcriptional regulator [Parasphingorhabdus sp.]